MLDHRPVGIAAGGHDLLGLAVPAAKREGRVLGPRRVSALDGERPLGADDLERLTLGRVERALERRREAVAEVEPARERGVDPGIRQQSRRLDPLGRPARGGQQRRHTVDPHVEQGAPAHLRAPAVVVVARQHAREHGAREAQCAEAAGGDEGRDRARARMEGGHVRLEERDPSRGARGRHRHGVGGGGSQRLLAQHVLAGRGRALHPKPVQAVGERNVDGVDRGVVEQLGVRAIGPLGAEARARVVLPLARRRDEPGLGAGHDRRQHRALGHPRGRPDHAPAER